MGRQISGIAAGFFCACTLMMGGYLWLQLDARDHERQSRLSDSETDVGRTDRLRESSEQPAPTPLSTAVENSVQHPVAASRSNIQLVSMGVPQAISSKVTWPNTNEDEIEGLDGKKFYVGVGGELEFDFGQTNVTVTLENGLSESASKKHQLSAGTYKFEVAPGVPASGVQATIEIREFDAVKRVYNAESMITGTVKDAAKTVDLLNLSVGNQTARYDGPLAYLTVAIGEAIGNEETTLTWNDGTPIPLNGEHELKTIGTYRVDSRGFTSGFDGDGNNYVNFVASRSFELQLQTDRDFAPTVSHLQTNITTEKLNGTAAETLLRTTLAELGGEPLRLDGDSVDIHATSPVTGRTLTILRGERNPLADVHSGIASLGPETATELVLTDVAPGKNVYFVADRWSGERSGGFVLVAPKNSINPPRIQNFAIGESELKPLETPLEVEGNSLTLAGTAFGVEKLELRVLAPIDSSTNEFRLTDERFTVDFDGDGAWRQKLLLTGAEGDYRILAVGESSDDHRFAKALPAKLSENHVDNVVVSSPVVTYNPPSGGAPKPVSGPANIAAANAVQLEVNLLNALADDRIVVTRGAQELASKVIKTPLRQTAVPVANLNPGRNDLEVRVHRGDRNSAPLALAVTSFMDGPTVERVTPDPLVLSTGTPQLTVSFKHPYALDAASVGHVGNYALFGADGSTVDITNAQYLPGSKQAVLTLPRNSILAQTYELRINGHTSGQNAPFQGTAAQLGIRDEFGNVLNGGSGNGSDYQKVLNGKSSGSAGSRLAGISSFRPRDQPPLAEVTATAPDPLTQRVGLPDTTGRQIIYPEYTKFREFANGFNPSDKVVTRVARLYYYRDAHRVTQIINRKAKSHNAQNATMSRRLADQARIFADQTTDRRKSAERRAVESAQYAREAENALKKYQQAAGDARQQADAGNLQQQRLEAAVAILEQEANDPTSIPDGKYSDGLTAKQRLDAAQIRLAEVQALVAQAAEDQQLNEERVNATVAAIEALRERELYDREVMEQEAAKEDRAIESQFRLEVQAAEEDPDTFAEGDPDSDDPVAQVSLTVIGEGLIQMRGPRKGVNIVHTMINQIDSPVGQVRVGIHTVQVNGENGQRMGQTMSAIERYVNHSRFLTVQSLQMLRKAIALVASRRAQEAGYVCDGISQVAGQVTLPSPVMPMVEGSSSAQRYQDAFFGKEFMHELRVMDSEFLNTDNKLLSLHSMDTTSLASALFVLSLASNDTRLEILETFKQMVLCELPTKEADYYAASLSPPAKRHGLLSALHGNHRKERMVMLGHNAGFVSLSGFFDGQIEGADTINPAQREFLKLAQILKSRLITEVELKQRVLERSVIEERLGDHRQQLRAAQRAEQLAREELAESLREFRAGFKVVLEESREIKAHYAGLLEEATKLRKSNAIANTELTKLDATKVVLAGGTKQLDRVQEEIRLQVVQALANGDKKEFEAILRGALLLIQKESRTPGSIGNGIPLKVKNVQFEVNVDGTVDFDQTVADGISAVVVERANTLLDPRWTRWLSDEERESLERQVKSAMSDLQPKRVEMKMVIDLYKVIQDLKIAGDFLTGALISRVGTAKGEVIQSLEEIERLVRKAAMGAMNEQSEVSAHSLEEALKFWIRVRKEILAKISDRELLDHVRNFNNEMTGLLGQDLKHQFAAAAARDARRPLDHKKFLDMLIDDTEEKFIELVEGTRAQTAVIDDFIKRIATAIDDDLNAQFYTPAFDHIEQESFHCNGVGFGQIERTEVLANNREFAKVRPQATMEFDLPRRRIMIAEAMQSAQAAYNDYGALMNDPSFLALTKLYSGQPGAASYNAGNNSIVRNVLPGLPSETGERNLGQSQAFQPEFNSQLEALIPDPAVYKFETGTGYEIRPVIQPDGQSVVFDFDYMYTTNIREPVRADEKHLGRVKRHFVNTDVQIGNYELREVSRYRVALKASRTSNGVPLLEEIPVAGALFRPRASEESSLQQNIILAKSVIYPTLFDLMGLRWAPAVADLGADELRNQEFIYRNRTKWIRNEVYDYSSTQVDEFLRVPAGERRADLYRDQREIPREHPGHRFPIGNDRFDSEMQEGYVPAPSMGPSPNIAPLMESPVDMSTAPVLPTPGTGIPQQGEFDVNSLPHSSVPYQPPALQRGERIVDPQVDPSAYQKPRPVPPMIPPAGGIQQASWTEPADRYSWSAPAVVKLHGAACLPEESVQNQKTVVRPQSPTTGQQSVDRPADGATNERRPRFRLPSLRSVSERLKPSRWRLGGPRN